MYSPLKRGHLGPKLKTSWRVNVQLICSDISVAKFQFILTWR